MRQLSCVGPRLIEDSRCEDFSLAVLEGVSEVTAGDDLDLNFGDISDLPIFEVWFAAHFLPHEVLKFCERRGCLGVEQLDLFEGDFSEAADSLGFVDLCIFLGWCEHGQEEDNDWAEYLLVHINIIRMYLQV